MIELKQPAEMWKMWKRFRPEEVEIGLQRRYVVKDTAYGVPIRSSDGPVLYYCHREYADMHAEGLNLEEKKRMRCEMGGG